MGKPAVNLMFRAFSDSTRLRILHLLLNGEMCVCDIVSITQVPQPTASRHLAYLRRAAKSAFHRSLVKCLKECFRDVPELASDAKRASRACCRPAAQNK
jgi:ArsR family transcriptional regulator, arsenate/arsenite/antimonite-responsive transcriptional repressor